MGHFNRYVCKELQIRRSYPVLDVIEAFEILQQPGLIIVEEDEVTIHSTTKEIAINQIIAPMTINQGSI